MSDPRLTPDPSHMVERTPRRVVLAHTNLCRSPGWPRDRQLTFGAAVTQFSQAGGFAYIQSEADGYVGFVPANALGDARAPTHRVSSAASTLYTEPDMKSIDRMNLSHGNLLTVTACSGAYCETPDGFAPAQHLASLDNPDNDPSAVAELYLGTPYLWGGNSRWGIDCSGLVQAALTACAIPCPGDSYMQMVLGDPATTPYKRNDLLFWKGHVALITDPHTIIHANAHTMAVNYEPINDAITRIQASGGGPVTAHRRL